MNLLSMNRQLHAALDLLCAAGSREIFALAGITFISLARIARSLFSSRAVNGRIVTGE